MMANDLQIAHMNFARLKHLPGDPRVAEFVDNAARVNAIAERSPGFVWRLSDDAAAAGTASRYETLDADPLLAISLSVWEDVGSFEMFVNKTVHGAFLWRRSEWFDPVEGANHVLWPVRAGHRPTVAEGWKMIARLNAEGPSAEAHDLQHVAASRGLANQENG
jgi:Domain of unknown function (DUF3291)